MKDNIYVTMLQKIKILVIFMLFIFIPPPIYPYYALQVGAFLSEKEAEKLMITLEEKGYGPYIIKFDKFYRVWIGKFKTKKELTALMNKLKKEGYQVIIKEMKEEIKKEEIKPPVITEKKEEIKKEKIEPSVITEERKKYNKLQIDQIFDNIDKCMKLKDELDKKGYFSYIIVIEEGKKYELFVGKHNEKSLDEIYQELKKEGYKVNFVE